MRHTKHYNEVRNAHIQLVETMLDRVEEITAAEIVSKTGIRRAKVAETLRVLIAAGRAHKSSGTTRNSQYRSGPAPKAPSTSTTDLTPFTYCGVTIRFDGKFMDATAMWRACGSPEQLRPSRWIKFQGTKDYLAKLSEKLTDGSTVSEDIRAVRTINGGTNPHTEMHELLAIKYAQDLRPDFAIECNRFILAWGRGEVQKRSDVSRGDLIALEQRVMKQFSRETDRAILEITTPMRIMLGEVKHFFANLNPFRA